jgi:hypothetical protein
MTTTKKLGYSFLRVVSHKKRLLLVVARVSE